MTSSCALAVFGHVLLELLLGQRNCEKWIVRHRVFDHPATLKARAPSHQARRVSEQGRELATEEKDGLGLSTMIQALRAELQDAQASGDEPSEEGKNALRFRLGPVEVEASCVVTRAGEGKAGVRFWVIEAGTGASRSDASTQRVKSTLQPPDNYAIGRATEEPR